MILGGEEMEVRSKMELFDKKFVYLEWDDKLKGKEVFLGDTLPQLRVSVNGKCNSIQEVTKNIDDDSFYPFISPCGTRYAMAYYDPNYSCKAAYAQGKMIQYKPKDSSGIWEDCEGEPFWGEVCEYRVKPEPEMCTACISDEGVVSIMPAREWNKHKGRQLIEGTEEKCKDFAIGNYCDKCARNASCAHQWLICDGKTLDTATRIDAWYCQGFMELKCAKKRRKTNRELAQWVWQGNGQVKNRDGYFTLISCTAYDVRDDDTPCPDYLVIRGWDETEWHEPEIEEA